MADKKKKVDPVESWNNPQTYSAPREEQSIDTEAEKEIKFSKKKAKRGSYSKGGKKRDDGLLISIGEAIFGR